MSPRRAPLLLALLAAAATPALAQAPTPTPLPSIAAALAEDTVEVKVNYSGARIVLFADAPPDEDPSTGLAVALIGPSRRHVVIRNTPQGQQRFEFVAAPSVFAGGAEMQVAEVATRQALATAGLDAAATAIPNVGDFDAPDLAVWRDALVRMKVQQGLYAFDRTTIERLDGGLRRARIQLPANAPPGEYRVRAVMFHKGAPTGASEEILTLRRGGMEETLFDLSRQHGFIYGLVAVAMAASIGAAAAWLGRRA